MNLKAQDDLEALLQDLGGQPAKEPEVAAPVAEPAPVVEAAQEGVPAPNPAVPALEAAQNPADADAEQAAIVSELLTLEKIRRQSQDNHGFSLLEAARKAFAQGDFATATEQYKQALVFIAARPATEAAINEAREGIKESYYQDALKAVKTKEYDKALPLASKAKESGHPKAQRLIDELTTTDPGSRDTDVSEIVHRINEKEYKTDQSEIRRRLRRARQFYSTGEYDKAQEECDLVLRDYPDNIDAMNMRQMVADRSKGVADIEFEATRALMIRDVRRTWTPDRYAIESPQLPGAAERVGAKAKIPGGITGTKTSEQVVAKKLRDIVIPEVTFRPPATIIDAVDFFKQASREYDDPEIPADQRGVNLVLKLPSSSAPASAGVPSDPFAAPEAVSSGGSGVPMIPAMSARFINLYDALKLVCDVTGMKFRIRGNIVMIVPLNDPDDELISRSYNVVATITDRVGAAQSELSSGRSSGESTFMTTSDMGGTQDWKAFFAEMGVVWPDGSSISYMSTIGKLRVTNTEEQLAIFEQVLEDLNVTPRLIEIEARFVEVNQNDLNSLGFEWLLNSDFSFDAGFVGDALDFRKHSNQMVPAYDNAGNALFDAAGEPLLRYAPYMGPGSLQQGFYTDPLGNPHTVPLSGMPGSVAQRGHNASVNAIDGNNFSTGNRYLSTLGNPVAPDGTVNDKFMQINAFLGNADVSMILHMLSQRSDSDLLSAPKVVTKSGQEAIMKVVTEYIYPTEFQVTMSQQGTTGGSTTTGGGTGEPLAIVEPQNFEMREVGVILQVVPEVSAEGQMINLMLNPQVVSEPVWKNYGTKIPKLVPRTVFDQVLGIMVTNSEIEYTELPMEQPFFPVRSVSTQLSIYNGATVVMGGLINEQRTTIEDKVPFLGDIPYLGRLFRSRSEKSDKRNLLVFVTARLVDPAGRFVKMSGDSDSPIMGGGSPALAPMDMGTGADMPSPF
ncbi:MAG: hypothetical protein PHO37_01475 [Kiritimatiellae bacterium]|nr:hypothetical protein [Kiritimatiellia bacterium]